MLINLFDVKKRLEENSLYYTILALGNDYSVIVLEHGGRFFGPFDKDGVSYSWINPAFQSNKTFSEFLKSKKWNLGGDRLWLAPENQFNVLNDNDFFGSYRVPSQIDPANYTLIEDSETVILKMVANCKLHNQPVSHKEYYIERTIRNLSDPLLSILDHGAQFFGYEHEIYIKEIKQDGILAEAWNLLQLNSGGKVIIPTIVKLPEYTQYYEEIPNSHIDIRDNYTVLKADGKIRYKVGLKSIFTTSRSAYVMPLDNGQYYLVIRCFYNNTNGNYTKNPGIGNNTSGHALHIYSDDGKNGNFVEHECSGQPIGKKFGRTFSTDTITTMFYKGDEIDLQNVLKYITGACFNFS